VTPEIRAFEYALGLFAVLIGLAIADIAMSFHRLVRQASKVRWDPLALLAAIYALCLAVCMWFDLWGVRHFAATREFFFYLSLIGEFFVLYLIAASSLPDDFAGSSDLRQYYAANRRYFWFLVALFQLIYVVQGFYFMRGEPPLPTWFYVLALSVMIAPLALALALMTIKSRAMHYIGLGLLFVIMLIHYGRGSIN
jgi:hypothetical protein